MISQRTSGSRLLATLIAFAIASALSSTSTLGEEPDSLRLVPANAAFYSCATRIREQFDTLMASRAMAKLREMPVVQLGIATAVAEWNDPEGDYAQFNAMIKQPENQQLIELLTDAVSNEVFVYGDESYAELLKLLQDFNAANQALVRDLGSSDGSFPDEKVAEQMRQLQERYLDMAEVPETVFGFKLSDTEPAIAQLARLEQVLNTLVADQPEVKQRLGREEIAGSSFLTMKLDGSLIPWNALEVEAPYDLMKVRQSLSEKKAKVAIGIMGDFLIVSVGDDTDHLESLGKGEVLGDIKQFATLKKHSKKQICSVSYASDTLMRYITTAGRQLDQLVTTAATLLPMTELEDSVKEEMIKDVEELVARWKTALPTTGGGLGFAFTTDRGYEGYSYSWSKNKSLDASQPLTILEHVGGDPILLAAGRGKYSPENYKSFAKLIERGIYYVETVVVPKLDADERDFFDRVRGDMARLVKQLDEITQKKLLPAFQDGQVAFVVDAKVSSKQWHESLPENDNPLPMLELGLVYGVSDPTLLKEGAVQYFEVIQEMIDTLHKAEPTTIPEYKLPTPATREFPEGAVYYYMLPRLVGLDKQVAPNAGLSADTLVLSAIPKTTRRLLKETPYKGDDIIAKHQGPAGAAVRFSLASLIDAVVPWIDYGIEVSSEAEIDEEALKQVQTGLEIAKCFRSVSTVTYQEDDASVTRYELHFEDLPE